MCINLFQLSLLNGGLAWVTFNLINISNIYRLFLLFPGLVFLQYLSIISEQFYFSWQESLRSAFSSIQYQFADQ